MKATQYSLAGLHTAWQKEWAFRLEVCLSIVLLPLAYWLGQNGIARALLVGSWLLVPICECLNSAIEATVDRVSEAPHPLAKRAKDLGSAAVFLACLNALIIWMVVLVSI